MAVLVLQPLAGQRRAPGRAADQEAVGLHVAGGPDEVADALEAEHRVEDVEGNHVHAVIGVAGAGGQPGAEGAGLVDALLQDLALLVLAVVAELVGILRAVELADRGVDADLPEHALHAEGARLVGDDRHDVAADVRDRG